MTKLLFAPLLIAALLVGSGGADAISAAVLASAAAWAVTNGLEGLAARSSCGLAPAGVIIGLKLIGDAISRFS
jgi:hypothetical protein